MALCQPGKGVMQYDCSHSSSTYPSIMSFLPCVGEGGDGRPCCLNLIPVFRGFHNGVLFMDRLLVGLLMKGTEVENDLLCNLDDITVLISSCRSKFS